MQHGREEPDPTVAAAVGMEIGSEQQDPDVQEMWNTAVHDFVTKLPGVTTKNQRSLLIKGQSLDHILSLSKVMNILYSSLNVVSYTIIKMCRTSTPF